MTFIQLGFLGRRTFLAYLATFLLTASAMLGFGLIPYSLALKHAGLNVDEGISTEKAISVLGENNFLALQLFPFAFALFVLLLCFRFIHQRKLVTLFTSRAAFDWKRFFLSFFAWGLLMSLMLAINAWMLGNPYAWNFNPATFGMLLAISVFVIPLQTTFEEAFFRGFLFQGFGSFFRKGFTTVLFTGLIFALLHGANPEVKILGYGILIYFAVTGIFLGLLTLMDDGLELSMGFHAINNIFGALIVTNKWQVFQSDALFMDLSKPSFNWETIVSMAVCYPLLMLLFARVFKWRSWREKLFGNIGKGI